LAANLEHNFGVGFDHYVVVQFSSLVRMIDKIGGVDITLDNPVDGRLQNMGYYSAGSHHLDGETALDFMRIRYPDTDFKRIDRQSMVLQALFRKARQDLTYFQQSRMALAALADRAVKTSLAVKDLGPLICLARIITEEQIHLLRIPSDYYQAATTTDGGSVQLPQPGTAEYIQSVMNGTYQAPAGN
jgi:anionic cell wall polymer biosynthesis LytR-Cps2A-Psr (LCP) family protein